MIGVTRGLGLLVFRLNWAYKAPLCRDHGTAIARNWLVATSLMGWWGIVSFFVNWISVAQDFNAWMAARRLAPAGSVVVPGGFGWQKPATSPYVPRAPLVAFAALILAVVGFAFYQGTFGSRSIGGLRVGSCFNEPPASADVVDEVASRPCTEAHQSEVFAVGLYPLPAGVAYPTAAQLETIAQNLCGPSLDDYVGGNRGRAGSVDIYHLTPTQDGWEKGDRRLVCYLRARDGSTLTHSLRG